MTDNRMRLNLHSNKTGLTLIIRHDEGLSAQDVMDAYRLVNRESHDDVHLTINTSSLKDSFNHDKEKDDAPDEVVKAFEQMLGDHHEAAKEFKSRPRATKLVGSDHRLTTPIGELADFTSYEDADTVKVKVDCPSCDYDGDVSVPEFFKFSKCPDCGLKLFNSWAGDGPGEVDFRGYAFYANTEMVFKNQEGADE